jgi:hypothetical protein
MAHDVVSMAWCGTTRRSVWGARPRLENGVTSDSAPFAVRQWSADLQAWSEWPDDGGPLRPERPSH